MLAEIYSWFTEGFDTRSLKEAEALLEELSQSTRAHGDGERVPKTFLKQIKTD